MLHRYEANEITVLFDAPRCTHVAECQRRLPSVFNTQVHPWVQPDQADADEVAAVVRACPTGALHYLRKDGGPDEEPPLTNTVRILSDGPLYVSGRLLLVSAQGQTLLEDTRLALCRCGRSQNAPFCDGKHLEAPRFRGSGALPRDLRRAATARTPQGVALRLTLIVNGPVFFDGPVTIVNARGDEEVTLSSGALCRCGASRTMPFCDGAHRDAKRAAVE